MKKSEFKALNDSEKQNILDRFVNNEINSCETILINYVLSKSYEDENAPFSHDDITNNEPWACVEINALWLRLYEDEVQDKIKIYEYLRDKAMNLMEGLEERFGELEEGSAEFEKLSDFYHYTLELNLERYQRNLDNLESAEFDQQPEIYQWFSCSNWLIRKLEQKGECTLSGSYWGRCCFGQAISLDNVTAEIYLDTCEE